MMRKMFMEPEAACMLLYLAGVHKDTRGVWGVGTLAHLTLISRSL